MRTLYSKETRDFDRHFDRQAADNRHHASRNVTATAVDPRS